MFKIFKYLKKKDLLYLFIAIGFIVLQVWLDLTLPDYTKKLSNPEIKDLNFVWTNGGIMIAIAFASMTSAIIVGYFSSHIAANFSTTLREKLFVKIFELSDGEIHKFSTASLITRTTNDVVNMQMFIAMGLQVIIKAPILAIWAVSKISNTSIEWTLAVLIAVIAMVAVIGIIVGLCYPRFKKIQLLTDQLNNSMRENISGVLVVRAFNAEKFQSKKFNEVNTTFMNNNLFTSRLMGLMMPVMTSAISVLTLSIYWIGASLINSLENPFERLSTFGNMMAFSQYALQVIMAFMMLIMIFILLPRSIVSARRINEVLDTEVSIKYSKNNINKPIKGKITFNHVTFTYPDGQAPCLKDLNFSIEANETFAIIGATGCGKTSLINLIPRFYDADEGSILIDGIDIKKFSQEDIINNISLAPQKAILFKDSVINNITYGSKDIIKKDDKRLKDVINISQSQFVYQLDKKLDEEISQGATNLSGGQKQRLSIARALFKKSKIVIFDDTFSALDYKTDMLVRKGLQEKLNNVTKIIVAQRIGTIKNADHILVLDQGKVVGLGTHKELLKNCPIYKEIALSQLKESEL